MAAGKYDYVNNITPGKESWGIVVRVVRLWFVPDMNSKQNLYAMEMVLMDEHVVFVGDKIQVSVRKALLSRFQSKLCDGAVYNLKSFGVAANSGAYMTTKHKFKLNLQSGTVVTKVETDLITTSPYI
ncbi:uncharacterized protein LOC131628499 [Vicia villosa]|uniref:uncharacterized protein LOC131628499 n=1 Tax=Vicia villosa TaxID=3911 RepID=UPI00273BAC20|nr:uncharacterized protein LOC131628499 [Vicia villosa]